MNTDQDRILGTQKTMRGKRNYRDTQFADERFCVCGCHLGGRDAKKCEVVSPIGFKDIGSDLSLCVISNGHLSTITDNVLISDDVPRLGDKETRLRCACLGGWRGGWRFFGMSLRRGRDKVSG